MTTPMVAESGTATLLEFIAKAAEIVLQMRFDFKNFILFESIQNKTNSQFQLILANQLYKIKKKLTDHYLSGIKTQQQQTLAI